MAEILTIIVILFMAMVIHEYAHAWTAFKLGDPTAKNLGRMSLNPLKHIDPFGTIALPILLMLLRLLGSPFFPIALAKPVPVNFLRLRQPKRDMMWVGMAGPAVNIIIAVGLSLIVRMELTPVVVQLIELAIFINLILAVFNMVPIPPLDGSRLVMGLLPKEIGRQYSRMEPYGIIIVFALLPLGLFDQLVLPVVIGCGRLLGVQFL